MKKIVLSIVALGTIYATGTLIAQRGNCSGEHNYCYPKELKNKGVAQDAWQFNNQSKSGLFAQDEVSEITLVLYKDTEYMLSFCTDNEQIEGKIQFKLYDFVSKQVYEDKKSTYSIPDPSDSTGVRMLKRDTTTRVVKYIKDKKLLFDNTKKETTQHFEFISDKTRKLLIEVFVPGSGGAGGEVSTGKGGKKGKKGNDEGDKEIEAATYSCVGMLVMHQKALKTGFQK